MIWRPSRAAIADRWQTFIEAAREAARRTQCRNNLKNAGLALLNYESTYKHFPTGGATYGDRLECYAENDKAWAAPKQGMSWAYQILPYLEQGAIQAIGNTDVVQNTPVPLFNCPSRRAPTQYVDPRWGPAYLMDYVGVTPATWNKSPSLPNAQQYDAQRDFETYGRVSGAFWMVRYKRLEVGTFELPAVNEETNHVVLTAADLALLLGGIDLASVRRRKRYRRTA